MVMTRHSIMFRGVAQSGSVSEWGSEGRWFKSTRPDHLKIKRLAIFKAASFFIFHDFVLIDKIYMHTHSEIFIHSKKYIVLFNSQYWIDISGCYYYFIY